MHWSGQPGQDFPGLWPGKFSFQGIDFWWALGGQMGGFDLGGGHACGFSKKKWVVDLENCSSERMACARYFKSMAQHKDLSPCVAGCKWEVGTCLLDNLHAIFTKSGPWYSLMLVFGTS